MEQILVKIGLELVLKQKVSDTYVMVEPSISSTKIQRNLKTKGSKFLDFFIKPKPKGLVRSQN
jgi:hypothetical protein